MGETNWREIFQVQEIDRLYAALPTQPGECNANCLEAKELVCVCRCGGKNHGAHLKQHIKPSDQFGEESTSDVDPVAETFNPEEYREELAVLA